MSTISPPPPANPLDVHWQNLSSADINQVVAHSGASIQEDKIRLAVMGQSVLIDCRNRMITQAGAGVTFLLQLVLLQYLLNARNIPLEGRLVNPKEFVGGEFFFRGPHALKMKPLGERFGCSRELFLQAGSWLGGVAKEMADAAFTLLALPKIPVTYVLWCADEEFPAEVKALFDATAEKHLPLDMLWSLVNVVNKKLLSYQPVPA